MLPFRDPIALMLALLLAAHGLRKGSLSTSGAIAAVAAGFATMGNPSAAFGVMLIVFYLTGSRATKVKAHIKAKLEVEASESSGTSAGKASGAHKAASGGQRDAKQVACNALTAALASLAYRILYSGELPSSPLHDFALSSGATPGSFSPRATLCLLAPQAASSPGALPRALLLVALGHFACCMGDTLASELGILAPSPPRLVTTLRSVPPGTNGGISVPGTLFSAAGGALIGLTCAVVTSIESGVACGGVVQGTGKLVLIGAVAGFGGSMLDSILGATLQRSWYNSKTKQVLVGGRNPPAKGDAKKDWQIITGSDVLSNNSVNFVSSATTGVLTAVLGSRLF